jgi:hypothetical protein
VRVRAGRERYEQGFITLRGAPLFPGIAREMYGRMHLWLESTPKGSVHFTFVQVEGPSSDDSYRVLDRFGGQHDGRLMANYETLGAATDCWDHSAVVMPTQVWVCLEWRFALEGNRMQLWVDGQPIDDIPPEGQGEGCVGNALDGKWLAPRAFDALRVGWEHYQPSDERILYLDDVAVGAARIGCD